MVSTLFVSAEEEMEQLVNQLTHKSDLQILKPIALLTNIQTHFEKIINQN